jgi:large subunit ribosomal protein L25
MKLTVKPRVGSKKSEIKQLRREGEIPAVIYSSKAEPRKMSVNGVEFSAVLRGMKPGHLPTTIFTLSDGASEHRAIIKDIQYDLTTYHVSHIDFALLVDDVPVTCIGAADCVGVKLGGFLRQVVRHVRVECLPKKIPVEFVIDVKDLGIRQSRRLKDIKIPDGVRTLADKDEVLVVIAKR